MEEIGFGSIEKMLSEIDTKESINRLQSIFNQLPKAVLIIDAEGEIQFVSESFVNVFNECKIEIGAHIEKSISKLNLMYLLQKNQKNQTQMVLLETGERLLFTCSSIIGSNGEIIGVVAFCEEFSHIIQTVERLIDVRDLESVFDGLIGTTNTAYFITDEQGVCQYANEAFMRLFSIKRFDVLGKKYKPVKDMHKNALKKRRAIYNQTVKTPNLKSSQKISGQVEPLVINGKLRGSIGLYQDITLFADLEEELAQTKALIRRLERTEKLEDVIANSIEMRLALEQVRVALDDQTPVLITGGQGTGKRLLSRVLHNEGESSAFRITEVDAALYDEQELRNKLFGSLQESGILNTDVRGTVIIHHIDLLALSLQEMLSECLVDLSVRLIFTSEKKLEECVRQATFSENLYNQIKRIKIELPELEKRKEDFEALVHHFIKQSNKRFGRSIVEVEPQVIENLKLHSWSANLEELKNTLEEVIMKCNVKVTCLKVEHLQNEEVSSYKPNKQTLQEAVEQYEKQLIYEVYLKEKKNKTKTAKALNVSVRSLYYKLERYGID